MSRTIDYSVEIQFGDCDPAGIVFFPNFSRWMDAASHHYFQACGLPPWHSMSALPGCVGAPLLEIHTRYHVSATYGEQLTIQSNVQEWRGKVFTHHHRVMRADTLICEAHETRALCVRRDDGILKAVPVPDFIIEACR